jgi:1,4-alpha-glucan branching enzyme
MAVDKHIEDRAGVVVVTFRLPPEASAHTASVVGDFNNWSPTSHAMTRLDDGFEVVVPLQTGRTYRFRYLLDGERWENDWAADAYAPNVYGGDDSVIDLTDTQRGRAPERAHGSAADGVARSAHQRARRRTTNSRVT